jgi:hypothetical protein
MIWTRMLAYITGTVDKELLLKNAAASQTLGRGRPLVDEAGP